MSPEHVSDDCSVPSGGVGRPAEVVVGEGLGVEGVGPVGDGLHMLWAVGIIDAAAKKRRQGIGMVLVVDGVGSGGAPYALDGIEVGVLETVPVGAVVMLTGEGGAQLGQS
ncbi:glycolate oxidase, putative [Babesia ovata]|uniref:Glycolate oxidase, putative n=1 Tax=Babesia ovata TaxID=189622 RepID=A0A2H6KG31_9APIC|nr:glycolate oxidase, putative [Babesia ovata]GBE61952.1 glycolate oxidase, putative [Babesia ovata]